MVTSSGGQSSSTVRRISPRRMPPVALRRRGKAVNPLSSPVRRRAVPTSLPLPTSTRDLQSVSSITVSLPRVFASELVVSSTENVTDAAINASQVTTRAGGSESVMTGDDATSLPAGL